MMLKLVVQVKREVKIFMILLEKITARAETVQSRWQKRDLNHLDTQTMHHSVLENKMQVTLGQYMVHKGTMSSYKRESKMN